MRGVKTLLDETQGSFVIADLFEKKDIERIENNIFKEQNFFIEKKDVITFNVKHAMNLDKPRVEKIV